MRRGIRRRVSVEHARAVEACLRPGRRPSSVPSVFVRPGERLPSGVRSVELEDGGELARRCGARPRCPVWLPPAGDARRQASADGHEPRAVRPARGRSEAGGGRRSSTPSGRARGGASAISATCARSAPGRGSRGRPCSLSIRCTRCIRELRRNPARTSPRAGCIRNPLYLRIEHLPGAREDADVACAPARGGAAPRCADHRPRPRDAAQAPCPRSALVSLPRRCWL